MPIQPGEWYVPREGDDRLIPFSEMTADSGAAGREIVRYSFNFAPESPEEMVAWPVKVEVAGGHIIGGLTSRLLPPSLLHRHRLGPYAAHGEGRALGCPSCRAEGAPED
jgi:hypothetical protein